MLLYTDGTLSLVGETTVLEVATSYQFCVMLQTQGTVEIDFEIVVHIIEGTATRDSGIGGIDKKRQVLSNDYSTSNVLVFFYPDLLCHTIDILDDEILEGNEDFGITIFDDVDSEEDPVLTIPSEKTVIIQDDESNTNDWITKNVVNLL